MQKKSKKFSTLFWAWVSLAIFLVVGVVAIQFMPSKDDETNYVAIDITSEPEKLAPFSNIDFERIASEISDTQPIEIAETNDKPIVVAELPESDIDDQEAVLQIEGDSAAVIKIADLPNQGEERTTTASAPLSRSVPPAPPVEKLIYQSASGPYPIIASDGTRSSSYYKRVFKAADDTPQISVIVAGLGLSSDLTQSAIDGLPANITLAFAPYTKDLNTWSQSARAAGHELMLEIPMETSGISNDALGPAALLTSYSQEQNKQRLDWMLSRFSGYFGVTNYLGGQVSQNSDVATPILTQIEQAGLAFIADSEFTASPLISAGAQTDVLISDQGQSIKDELAQLEKISQARGKILVKIYPNDTSLNEISVWAERLEAKGIALAPASAMLQ